MNIPTPTRRLALAAVLVLVPVAVAMAQDADPKVLKDLGTVIILQGYPCGKAVSARKLGEDDYLVTCESGDRYEVSIDKATDRVVIQKK